jgi:hypothetical protein
MNRLLNWAESGYCFSAWGELQLLPDEAGGHHALRGT